MIKDYTLEVHYHPKKANVVVDALSRKSREDDTQQLTEESFNLMHPVVLHSITLSSSLADQIIEGQKIDKGIFHIK